LRRLELELFTLPSNYKASTIIKQETDMEPAFYTFHDFMTHTKGIAYLLIGVALIALPLFWQFLTGRDNKKKTF
jgi:hypothetical protein